MGGSHTKPDTNIGALRHASHPARPRARAQRTSPRVSAAGARLPSVPASHRSRRLYRNVSAHADAPAVLGRSDPDTAEPCPPPTQARSATGRLAYLLGLIDLAANDPHLPMESTGRDLRSRQAAWYDTSRCPRVCCRGEGPGRVTHRITPPFLLAGAHATLCVVVIAEGPADIWPLALPRGHVLICRPGRRGRSAEDRIIRIAARRVTPPSSVSWSLLAGAWAPQRFRAPFAGIGASGHQAPAADMPEFQ